MAELGMLVPIGIAFIGLLVGSFLNVVVARVPEGRSIVRPGSACPHCGTPIRARDNVPLLSWLLLRARCRTCHAPISIRYPLVEFANAAAWLAAWWWADANAQLPMLPLILVLVSGLLALALIDLDHHRLPDAIVLPLQAVTVLGLALAVWLGGEARWLEAVYGAAIWVAIIGALWLLTRGRGMGFGDVKLAPVLGATLGWIGVGAAAVGVFAAFVVGAIVGIGLLLAHRAGRRSQVPFGPFLITGWVVGLVWGPALWNWYAGLGGA